MPGESSEQSRRQERGPPSVQSDGRGPQKARDSEHEAQRQNARGRQASDAVRERAERRIDDGGPGEI